MKRLFLISIIFIASLSLTACAASQDGIYSGKLILEGDLVVPSGQTETSSILLLNGTLTVEEGARLHGNVYQVLGTFTLDGTLDGDILQFGGSLISKQGALVTGNIQTSGGTIEGPVEEIVAGEVESQPVRVPFSAEWFQESLQRQLTWNLVETILLTGLAWILTRSFPSAVERISTAATRHVLVSGAMGLLAGIVSLALIVQMIFTVLLIPVSFLGLFLLFISIGLGWIGFGLTAGLWLTERFNLDWSFPLTAAAGTLVFMLVINLFGLIPGISDLLTFVTALVGVGAVFLTRFGTREFVPAS